MDVCCSFMFFIIDQIFIAFGPGPGNHRDAMQVPLEFVHIPVE